MRLKGLEAILLCIALWGCIADEVGGVYLVSESTEEMPSARNYAKDTYFQAGDKWRAWSSDEWLDVYPKEGNSGRNSIRLRTAEANHTSSRRMATVTIESGGKQQLVTVWQRNDYALFDPKEYVVDAAGGEVNLLFSSNVSKDSLLISYMSKEWIKFEGDTAKTRVADWNGKIRTLHVQPNPTPTERSTFFVLVMSAERRIDYQVLDTAWVRQLGK